ncbi:acyltransferase family protein [Sphingobacterium humi]|uniref:Acyltransferase family protein n=1 Tax=Sphingobacterium humi TaxID=1796905 RepID=A0A6N8L2S6_9SPHI|nr:acyltransferase family protein [Sphingobacterium humi]MVZ63636.1 acyltransferase family protein [Sphingobacterium humi]
MRYDIVFLRCIAVLSVVLYHLRVPLFANGYLGVDIFFVVSGFLISQIILEKQKQKRFKITQFYIQRAKRIIPPLATMLVATLLLIYILIPLKVYDFARFGFSSILFLSNAYYHSIQDYFAPSAQLNFLLHTWTLSLEWQFYLLYPLLIISFQPGGRKSTFRTLKILSVLMLLSFVIYMLSNHIAPRFAYYMLPARAWEFFAGGIISITGSEVPKRLSLKFRQWGGAIAIISLMIIILSKDLAAVRGINVLLTVALTSLVLWLEPNFSLFRHRLSKFFGNISYSWYLWHWPLIVLGIYFGGINEWWIKLAIFLISLILGWTSWHYVEIKRTSLKVGPLALCYAITLSVLFLGTKIIFVAQIMTPMSSSLTRFMHYYPRVEAHGQFGFGETHSTRAYPVTVDDLKRNARLVDSSKNYLLLGDCHAGMFARTIEELSKEYAVNLIQVTLDDTFPAPSANSSFNGNYDLMSYVFDSYIPNHYQKIDKVILSANYAGYSKDEVAKLITDTEKYFARYQIPTVYIGQTEAYNVEYPVVWYMKREYDIPGHRFLRNNRTLVNETMKKSSISKKYVDVYCSDIYKDDQQGIYMYDTDHFSIFGTDGYKPLLRETIFNTIK